MSAVTNRHRAQLVLCASLSLFSTAVAHSDGEMRADWPYTPLPPQAAVAEGKAKRGAFSEARAAYIRSHYTKFEYHVPMRDGVKLFTAVYVPNDAGPNRRYPFMLYRTPYSVGPYGAARYAGAIANYESMEHEGFIFALQDVRGMHMSEGEFVNMRPQKGSPFGAPNIDETTDCYDTIDWLIKHVENNNGRAGMWGTSYPGFYAAAGAIDSHPALKAISPQAPIADWFLGDDMHRHGAFALEMAFDFFAIFGLPRPKPSDNEDWWEPLDHGTPDVYRYYLNLGPLSAARSRFRDRVAFWEDIVAHPNYDGFWQARNLLPRLRNVHAATMVVGGWYDSEDLYGPLHIYNAFKNQNGAKSTLVIGPWIHGGWSRTDGSALGDADFGMKASEIYAAKEHAFFVHHLKDGKSPDLPGAFVFETGANRWRSFSEWPPRNVQTKDLFFQPGSRLGVSQAATKDVGFDEYLSDPNRPVPYCNDSIGGCGRRFSAEDQRFAAARPDVLSYMTEPLQSDLTLAGPIDVDLWVSTTGSDADFVVKLIDMNPDRMPGPKRKADDTSPDRGGQMTMVRGEPMRARFRDSYERPQPMQPNQPTRVRFTANDVFHTFARGHRVMVQVQSSWFPFIDRNPQTFMPSIYEARTSDFVKATHRVYHTPAQPSRIVVRVLPE